ncbi:MAG: hypothetical protein CL945_03230 [Dinoroseobacter sp.]|jgi:hypothetical protein|uniref:DUF3572 domain-containing protein n=1 Tax=Alterinioella nitratireducens TaxID=2735915 RepID=UPI000C919654|nr:DUF3572 domain-containing protein [Alterinioella nitratireducens]MAN13710.1 hypothetical protein [Dinoroseobacter sp.]NPD18000.1 DUF3572 domain-containing protein [Alterinioella nitratireducens]|tara:strand:- start:344 stop:622 length:279 start_codon:yes stop_codon:yes gene_type:complete
MNVVRAEETALNAMAWLVGNDELLPVFLGATGASLADLRAQAGETAMQLSLLDFLMMDDAWVMACCDALGLPYETLLEARQSLPGGAETSWT